MEGFFLPALTDFLSSDRRYPTAAGNRGYIYTLYFRQQLDNVA